MKTPSNDGGPAFPVVDGYHEYSHHADDLIAENVELRAERDQLRDELDIERARLRKIALDACKSAQIKPVAWYPTGYPINPNDFGEINEQQVEACVAAIDAAMKEDAK
jgi:regulator of replication initiation timing